MHLCRIRVPMDTRKPGIKKFPQNLTFQIQNAQLNWETYCIRFIFGVLKISLYSPAGGYLFYFKCAHSSTQTVYSFLYRYYLKDVILALSWGVRK